MFSKFIITDQGVLKFGNVYMHRDLLQRGEKCTYGGGLWKVDEGRGAVLLYGRSFDFGLPDFDYVRRIEWSGIEQTLPVGANVPHCLLYLPHWPSENQVVPVFVK